MPTLVVADTNALLMPFERRIRIEPELERLLGTYEILVPDVCLNELGRIASEEKGARRDRAKMALSLAARFKSVAGNGAPDEVALRIAKERGAHLFTNDAALAKRAMAEGVPVIRMRGLSHLIVEARNE
ncbi:MAG: PIN domain-containing protein [Euryarchaeota archaeon]|nr:PIN domain-containing protein [Euryarchaeota archaeon]